MPERSSVRLGRHGDEYVFDAAAGLHDAVMRLAVLGVGPDPEVIFEEHGVGEKRTTMLSSTLISARGAYSPPNTGPG